MKFLDKEWKGKNYRFYVQRDQNSLWIHFQGQTWLWKSEKLLQKNQSKIKKKESLILSPLPGRIQRIFVKKNDKVKEGQNLLILSAMKMEYSFKSEGEAQVEEVFCEEGQTVDLGKKLVKMKYADSD